MPDIAPPRHDLGASFRHLFGKRAHCLANVNHCGTVCNLTRPNSSLGSHIWMGHRPQCFPEQLDVSCSQGRAPATGACRCDRIVTLLTHNMIVHYDYSWTHSYLRAAYWQSAVKNHPPHFRHDHFDVVMHVRLGDVRGGRVLNIEWAKYFPPASYQGVVSALTQVLPGECFHLTIVTDGAGSDSDIKAISENARELSISHVSIYDKETSAKEAFRRMTHADVLLCGGSGFSRLAAVMLPEDRPRVCISSESHPLGYLGNLTELRLQGTGNDTTIPKAVSLLRQNAALQSLAATCKRALKK